MIALVQRVNYASVKVDNKIIASIDKGMLVLVGVEKTDSEENAKALFEKLRKFRLFADEHGKLNLNISQAGGQILLVPQFSLPADTHKGNRPGFSNAAPPALGKHLFEHLTNHFATSDIDSQTGIFQADMKVLLENDGPLTFWIQK